MPSVALIGPDGAGKTTVARRLERDGPCPIRYLYMGINTASSNLALPSSRLVERLKPRLAGEAGGKNGSGESAPGGGGGAGRERGAVWRVARLLNRLAEEWYRQFVSWSWELRGYVVVHDRHFLFDFAPGVATPRPPRFDERLHRWLLARAYPRPGLVIFLDAPGTVLFARKGESTPADLERRRQGLLRLGRSTPGFVRVDATRPLDEVCDEVRALVSTLHRGRRSRGKK